VGQLHEEKPVNNEKEIEQEIQDRGLNAPRLRPEDIDRVILAHSYTILPGGRTMICELTLANGFTVRGESSVVSAENFDEEIGKRISWANAREKIWQLEAYLLKQRLHDKHMEEVDEATRTGRDWLARLRLEAEALGKKLKRLEDFIERTGSGFSDLSDKAQILLHKQYNAQLSYHDVLLDRIELAEKGVKS
jgi:hypothetical protein